MAVIRAGVGACATSIAATPPASRTQFAAVEKLSAAPLFRCSRRQGGYNPRNRTDRVRVSLRFTFSPESREFFPTG
jgi:hypothetical protein